MRAAEQDEEAAEQWMIETNGKFGAEQLVSVDETSKDGRIFYRGYGYALHGQEAIQKAPFSHGEHWSLLPALTVNGYIMQRAVIGGVKTKGFTMSIIEQVVHMFSCNLWLSRV